MLLNIQTVEYQIRVEIIYGILHRLKSVSGVVTNGRKGFNASTIVEDDNVLSLKLLPDSKVEEETWW